MYRVKLTKSHPCLKENEITYKEFELLEDALEYEDAKTEVLFQSLEVIRGVVEELSPEGNWVVWKDEDGYTSSEYTTVNGKIMRIV